LLPSVMLKPSDTGDLAQTLFLDDMSVTEVSAQLNCPIIPVDDTDALVQQCCAPPLQSRSASLQPATGYWVPS